MASNIACDPVAWAVQRLTVAGIDSPRLEAQLLLALALGITRSAVIAGLFEPLGADQLKRFEQLVGARADRVPLAYLRGTQEFYGLEFEVSPAVLIPRPETEMLVDFVLGLGAGGRIFADVGTGSGCIAIAALVHSPGVRCVALDLSDGALEIAKRNAARHGVQDRLEPIQSDLLTNAPGGQFDLIVSNPPYIAAAEMEDLQPEVRDAEPRIALEGGADGLAIYRRLVPSSPQRLAPGGALAVEVGMGQAAEVAELFRAVGFLDIEIRNDLAGIGRVVVGYRETGAPMVKLERNASVNRETGEGVEWQPKV